MKLRKMVLAAIVVVEIPALVRTEGLRLWKLLDS